VPWNDRTSPFLVGAGALPSSERVRMKTFGQDQLIRGKTSTRAPGPRLQTDRQRFVDLAIVVWMPQFTSETRSVASVQRSPALKPSAGSSHCIKPMLI